MLLAPGAFKDGAWSREYSDAHYRLPGQVARHAGDEGYVKKLAELVAACSHDSNLSVVILNAMDEDGPKLALLRELARDFEPKMSLLAMAEALDRVRDHDRKDLPDTLLPVLERLLPLDDARFVREGWATPFSEVFRSRSVQLLSEHFASDDRFVDYLWRLTAKAPTYEKCRYHEKVLGGYTGPRADELLSRALGDRSRLMASFALSLVVQSGRASLYPLAAKTAVALGKRPEQLEFIYPMTALEKIGLKHVAGVTGLIELYEAVPEYQILTALLHIVAADRRALGADHWKRLMQIISRHPESVSGVGDLIGRADLGPALAEIRATLSSTRNRQVAWAIARGLAMQPDELQQAALSGIEKFPVESKLGFLDGWPRTAPGKLLSQALAPLRSDPNPEVAAKVGDLLDAAARPLRRPRDD